MSNETQTDQSNLNQANSATMPPMTEAEQASADMATAANTQANAKAAGPIVVGIDPATPEAEPVYSENDAGLDDEPADHESIIQRAEEAIEAAAEAVEHVAEEVIAEAETLADEAVTEVKKVWNNHLQAWV